VTYFRFSVVRVVTPAEILNFMSEVGQGCDDQSLDRVLLVRAAISAAARRQSATVLRDRVSERVLVRAAPVGRTRHRRRYPDDRRHQERQPRSVHASTRARFARAGM
jgi:hypothetical protein